MKRTRKHVLETESRRALERLLPPEWIFRPRIPDYGIDAEIEIVEEEEVTNKVLWLQLKATEKRKKKVSYQMRTDHLKYYEKCRMPVLIIYWIKRENTFYYLFAQKYIKENLSTNPEWRNQKTVAVTFDSVLSTAKDIESMATDGYLYLLPQQITIGTEKPAIYWVDGIPRSDDEELKERSLRALLYSMNEMHHAAIDVLEQTLKVCVLSPTEKMSVLLNLGNAYYALSQNGSALKNYEAMLELAAKVDEKSAIEGKSAALGNIGLIYSAKGDLDEALKYHKEALEIHRDIGYRQGEASDLGNLGLVYSAKGDLDEALKYHKATLDIHRDIGYRQGEASDLGNIGLVYSDKGDLDEALKYHKEALDIHRDIGYRQGEASQLGNIGLIYSAKGDLDEALKYHKEALDIHRDIGYRQGEANQLGNIGLIYSDKGDLD
ncbi:MAG: tetratricopeptide repeat protein, partial [Theionarchaea archaeon]|nr:tetratricopeptide repeat protein [Theionarchaea archaeon]